ncbi:MAG: hypothetical protein GXN93_01485 [Candidatus Diapherotrites archaeon]|nr:hypothetical protein [Candidatus Diapherotrites archaeon]
MRQHLEALRRRAEKAKTLHPHKLALVSISQSLFVFGVILLILAGNLDYFVRASRSVQIAYFFLALVSFVFAYVAYDRVREVDFLDFLAMMVYTHHARSVPHGAIIDSSASLFLLGLIVLAIAPLVYLRYASPLYGAITLVSGAILVVISGVGYVLSHKAYSA